MPLKILLMIIAAIAANWFLYEQPLLTRFSVGLGAALIVAFVCDCWVLVGSKKP